MNRFLLATVFVLVADQSSTSEAGTYYVRESGRDRNRGTSSKQALRTVQKAIGLARPGDTIYVGKGRFSEFTIRRKSGTQSQPIRIVGDLDGTKTGDKGRPVFIGNRRSRYRGVIFLSRVQHIHFSGLAIGGGREDGFRITDSRNIRIRDCEITGMPDDGILIEESDATVENCSTIKNGGDGIITSNSTVTVSQCKLDGNRGAGFNTYNSSRRRLSVFVNRCRITNNRREGLNLRYGAGRIHNCLIAGNSREGIKNWGTYDVVHCTIVYNGNDGVEQENNRLGVSNCIIAFNAQSGVQIDGGSMRRSNNCIWGNRQGHFTRTELATGELLKDPKLDRYYRLSIVRSITVYSWVRRCNSILEVVGHS